MVAGLALVWWLAEVQAASWPLAGVHYFNPYLQPTQWSAGGSAIYQGGGATVRTVGGAIPVDAVGGVAALVLDAVNPPGGWWSVFFKVSGNPLNWQRTGADPAIHLRLRWAAVPGNGQWGMLLRVQGGVDYGSVREADVPLSAYVTAPSDAWQDVYVPASAFAAARPGLDLTHIWAIALLPTGHYTDPCTLQIATLDLVPSARPEEDVYTEYVKVNQVGYTPLMASKRVLVTWSTNDAGVVPPTRYRVVDPVTGQEVWTGGLTRFAAPNEWQASGWTLDGEVTFEGDFGGLRTPGVYRVEVPELGACSPVFGVATNVYHTLFRDSLRFFYYSRSGVAIAAPQAEGHLRPAVHPGNTNAPYNYDPARGHFDFGAQTTRDVHGGWCDAGDTHMDVPNTALGCWFLLETARDFGDGVGPGSLDLPESGPAAGDLVPLIAWALEWVGRMQNADGSVCHYVLGQPNTLSQPQRVSDVSSAATACAAGIFAKAYAVLGGAAPSQATGWLARARLAWAWLEAHPDLVQPRLPLQGGVDPGGDDGSWGDALFDRRCRAFASVELFEATGEAAFHDAFATAYRQNGNSPLDGPVFGPNTTGYAVDGVLTYLNHLFNGALMDYARSARAVDGGIRSQVRAAWLHQADVLTNYTALSGYRIPMLYPGHLYWGSSGGVLAPSAMVLARAFEWTGNPAYHEAALQALHFICGRNPVGRVFVSGYGDGQHGSDFYSHFWMDLAHPPPGYLGGNIDVDGSAAAVVAEPWKRFLNTQDADMTEPGVYWNGAFAWLAGYAATDAMPPALRIRHGGSGVELSWPLRSAPFGLDAAGVLSKDAWRTNTSPATLSDRVWRIWLSAPDAAEFFRLGLP